MKLYQIAGYWFPDWRAECFQTARMAQGFLDCGVEAVTVYPRTLGELPWQAIGQAYGLNRMLVPYALWDGLRRSADRARRTTRLSLRLSLAALIAKSRPSDVFYGRHPEKDPLSFVLSLKTRRLLRARVFVELHDQYPAAVHPAISGYVVTNGFVRDFLADGGVPPDNIVVAPHAVDIEAYRNAHRVDRGTLRRELGWPAQDCIICYTGQLYRSRNVETLVSAMEYLDAPCRLIVVGGRSAEYVRDLQALVARRGLADRVAVIGQQPAAITLRMQMAADVLAIPYDSKMIGAGWCSPLKLPEYLATGRPIAAFRTPPLRSELRDDEVVWATEESAAGLGDAIRRARSRQPRGFDEVESRLGNWTWADRARRVADFIGLPHAAAPPRLHSPAAAQVSPGQP